MVPRPEGPACSQSTAKTMNQKRPMALQLVMAQALISAAPATVRCRCQAAARRTAGLGVGSDFVVEVRVKGQTGLHT